MRSKTGWFAWPQGVLWALCLGLFLAGCQEEVKYPPFPRYPVYYLLRMQSAEAVPLLSSGGYVFLREPRGAAQQAVGLGGLLVVHSPYGSGSYFAYDLACPVERDKNTIVVVDSLMHAYCPTCHTSFDILYGTGQPQNDKKAPPLQRYFTQLSADRSTLMITN